jgi:hypothetical protein
VLLKDKFGVSVSEMTDQILSDAIQVEVNQEKGYTTTAQKPFRFLANLLTKIPAQILFLIRLFFSVFMVVALTGAIFAFFPEVAYDEGKRRY